MSSRIFSFAAGCIVGSIGTYLLLLAFVPHDIDRYETGESSEFARRSGFSSPGTDERAEVALAPRTADPDIASPPGRAEQVLNTALRASAALNDPGERRLAVMRVGKEWAWMDPQAALAQASTLPPELQADYRASVTGEWANLDAEGFLDYAERAPEPERLTAGLRLLIASAPGRVFEITARLPNNPTTGRSAIETAAMRALAELDSMAAIERLASFPPGSAHESMLSTVLSVYARESPDAALAWLDARDKPSDSERWAVIRGIALADFDRGYELAADESATISWSLADAMVRDPEQTAKLASELLEFDASLADQLLESMAVTWARRDPERVVDWIIENSDAIDSPLSEAVGRTLAMRDFESAMAYLDRLPVTIRDTWIAQIAGPYAEQDPIAALDWVAQYQGQAPYQGAYSRIVMQAADSHPELAATMIRSLAPALQSAAAPRIASAWAKQDPEAALNWVLGLQGLAAESDAVDAVVSNWAQNDPEDATQWVMGLPRGKRRDSALYTLIANSHDIDPRPILDEIDAAEMRRYAKQRAITAAADPDVARELLETMVDDPEFGDWAQNSLEALGGARP